MTTKPATPRLSDVQLLLLSSALNRSDGSLLPPPATLGADLDERCRQAITGLIRRKLAVEEPTEEVSAVWRDDDDVKIGAFITDAGRAIIAAPLAEEDQQTEGSEPKSPAKTNAIDAPTPRPTSKIANVVAMLRQPEGVTLGELVEATGWLPHTTRAALTGLRKKDHPIERSVRGDRTCYRLPSVN